MDKMHYPRGLIRYATQNALNLKLSSQAMFKRVVRPRVLIYAAVLLAISTAFVVSLGLRHTLKVDVVRDRATLAREVEDGWIENLYSLQLMNATERTQRYRVSAQGLPGLKLSGPTEVDVLPAEARWITLGVRVPPQNAQAAGPGAHPIQFVITPQDAPDDGVSERSTFIVPN
jgi:polyferredoxin